MEAGSGGDAGQLTRSPGSSSASLPYVVTVDSALALAQLLQPSLAFVVAAIIYKFYRKFYCKFYCTCDQSITIHHQLDQTFTANMPWAAV